MQPNKKLRLLKKYMNRWIDNYPDYKLSSFEAFIELTKTQGKIKKEGRKLTISTPNVCQYCEKHFSWEGVIKTEDHVIPLSKGGKIKNNITNACLTCNQWKGSRDLSEWLMDVTEYYLAGKYRRGYGGKRIELMMVNIRKLQELKNKKTKAA